MKRCVKLFISIFTLLGALNFSAVLYSQETIIDVYGGSNTSGWSDSFQTFNTPTFADKGLYSISLTLNNPDHNNGKPDFISISIYDNVDINPLYPCFHESYSGLVGISDGNKAYLRLI